MQRKKAGWFHAFLKLPVKSALYGSLKCSGLADSVTVADAGLNTGTVIIRNSDWSRMLVEDMATYGKYPVDWSKEATLRAGRAHLRHGHVRAERPHLPHHLRPPHAGKGERLPVTPCCYVLSSADGLALCASAVPDCCTSLHGYTFLSVL